MTVRTGCRVRYRHLKPKRSSRATDGYKSRNNRLPNLGYASYQEYLASDDWKEIRDRRLRESPRCCVCGGKATQVHHYCYFDSVMLGLVPELLFPLCELCHKTVEFSGEHKRTLKSSQRALLKQFSTSGRQAVADKIQNDYFAALASAKKARRARKSTNGRRTTKPN